MVLHKAQAVKGIFKNLDLGGDSLCGWVRVVMTEAGVLARWTSGSICSAASSRAADKGMDLVVVMRLGRWSSWSV